MRIFDEPYLGNKIKNKKQYEKLIRKYTERQNKIARKLDLREFAVCAYECVQIFVK